MRVTTLVHGGQEFTVIHFVGIREFRAGQERAGGTKTLSGVYSVPGWASCWEKACFFSAGVRKGACRDMGRLQRTPQTEDFPGEGNTGEVCCLGVSPSAFFFHSCATWARQ